MVNCNAGSTDSNTVRTVIFVERLYHVLNVFFTFPRFLKFNSFSSDVFTSVVESGGWRM